MAAALHPDQIEVVNSVFTPAQETVDKAAAIIEAYRRATDADKTGAVMLGDEMIDEASRKLAVAVMARAETLGVQPRPWSPRRATDRPA